MRKARNYINNRALFEIMQKYRLLALEAKEAGDVPPPADKYVGEAILKICYNLAKKKLLLRILMERGYDIRWIDRLCFRD